jgi:hypothetical protein
MYSGQSLKELKLFGIAELRKILERRKYPLNLYPRVSLQIITLFTTDTWHTLSKSSSAEPVSLVIK